MTDRTIASSRARSRRLVAGWRWLLVAAGGALLAGCAGGSGSSGFITAAAENRAIDRALDEGGCVVEGSLTICASEAVAAPPTRTPSATPPTDVPGATPTLTPPVVASPTPTVTTAPAPPVVDVALDPTDVAACAAADQEAPCTLRLTVVPTAVSAGAAYRAAVRQRHPDGAWRVMPVTDQQVAITVAPEVTTLQAAVLVYESDPGPVPEELRVLSDSGADFAFVTPPLAVRAAP